MHATNLCVAPVLHFCVVFMRIEMEKSISLNTPACPLYLVVYLLSHLYI